MQEELKILLQIQEKDIDILDLERKSKKMPQELDAAKNAVEQVKVELNNKKEAVKRLQVAHKSLEIELETELENVKKNEITLTKVKTNEEYKAVQKQIMDIKYKAGLAEDKILEKMEEIEQAKKIIKETEEKVAATHGELQKQEKEVKDQVAAIMQHMGKLKQEKEELKSRVDESLWQHYNRIFENKSGAAIVPIENSICQGCHMKLPPDVVNQTRKAKEAILCENCARMLFWPG